MTENTPTPAERQSQEWAAWRARYGMRWGDFPEVLAALEAESGRADALAAILVAVESDLRALLGDREERDEWRSVLVTMLSLIETDAPADALAARDADKWDEGHLDGCDDQPACPGKTDHLNRNPYRIEREAGA